MTERDDIDVADINFNSQDSRADLIDSRDEVAPLPPKSYSPERQSLKLVIARSEERKSVVHK